MIRFVFLISGFLSAWIIAGLSMAAEPLKVEIIAHRGASWDAPENIAISSEMMPIFQSLNDESTETNRTNYFVVVGANAPGQHTLFLPDQGTTFASVVDGTSNTLMVIELKGIRGSWAAPIDPKLADIKAGIGSGPGQLTPCQPRQALIGLADGSVRRSQLDALNRVFPLLVIIDDGQAVDIP